MKPQEWRQLLSEYLDNALSAEDKAIAEKLLQDHPECRDYLNQLRAVSMSLQRIKDESLSPDAEIKILNKINKGRDMVTNFRRLSVAVLSICICIILYQQYNQPLLTKTVTVRESANYTAKSSPIIELTMHTAKSPSTYSAIMPASINEGRVTYQASRGYERGAAISAAASAAPAAAGMLDMKSASLMEVGAARVRSSSYLMNQVYYPATQDSYVGYSYNIPDTAEYKKIDDNSYFTAANNPLSTFSIDVDTASYSNVRRFLAQNTLPPKDAVRIEEMINYFSYNYPQPKEGEAFSITTNSAVCPWNKTHQLFHIGLKGKVPDAGKLMPSNLVFLIDVSGSMGSADRLPLVQEGLKMMVQQLRPEDKVSLVVYAGSAGVVLEPTSGDQKERIINAINNLQAGGSTAGGQGIELAYKIAKDTFIKDGNNRVVLATDGDFNVGVSDTAQLTSIIEEKRKDGIFLTVLGVGQDNLKDGRMMQIANTGNGNYYYLDTLKEAQKVLVRELGSTIYTIAKDVKIQVEFNPGLVKEYRLIGYEKRVLAKEDFNNDKKDAGEIGAGHTITALYEIVPVGAKDESVAVDALKYQKIQNINSDEIMTVKLRYKEPTSDTSKLITRNIKASEIKDEPTGDFAWAAFVAEAGMLLRNSEFKGESTFEHALKNLRANVGDDKFGLKAEFINLIETARNLAPTQSGSMQFKE